MSQLVGSRRTGPVTVLTLRRPREANALDLDLARELAAAVSDATTEPSCAVIVIASDGDIFCAGGDVAAMTQAESPSAYVRELAGIMHDTLLRIAHSDRILVIAVQGVAAGAGLALVLNADLVVAAEQATFLSAYAAVGLSPDCGVSYLLPRTVGRLRANQMVLGGARLDASTAAEWGLVNRVVSRAELLDTAKEMAARVARIPAPTRAASKRLLGADVLEGYAAHLDAERQSISALSDEPESIELRRRFLARSAV